MKKIFPFIFMAAVFALSVAPAFAATLSRSLDLGAQGEDVAILQKMLSDQPEVYPESLVTGFYGPLTAKAVVRFQEKYELPPVGRVGPMTLQKLQEVFGNGTANSSTGVCAPGEKFNTMTGMSCASNAQAMMITLVAVSAITPTSANISWTTDKPATTKIIYATTTLAIGSSVLTLSSNNPGLTHLVSLSQLSTSTTYYYSISSTDKNGITLTSSPATFTTGAR